MKILFCPCHYTFGDRDLGSELSWAFQIGNRVANKYTNSLIVTGYKYKVDKQKYRVVELQKTKEELDMSLFNTLKFNFLYSKYAYFLIKRENFDILHHVLPFQIGRTFNISIILRGRSKVKTVIGPIQSPLLYYSDNTFKPSLSIVTRVFNYINKHLLDLLRPILQYLSLITMRKADRLIVINETTKRNLVMKGINPQKIVIIPPGIDSEIYKPKLAKNNTGLIEVISVGRLIQRKGFDKIIRVIAEVVKINPNIRLRILGDGPQRKTLEKLVKKYSVEEYIIFEGHISYKDISKFYAKAHILLAMSTSEGFSTVCLEAMASGLAIVSTKVGGFMEAVKEDENGYLIESGDLESAVRKIISLASDQSLLKSFGERSLQIVDREYDWKKRIIPKYEAVYTSLNDDTKIHNSVRRVKLDMH